MASLDRLMGCMVLTFPSLRLPSGLYFPQQRLLVVDQPTPYRPGVVIINIQCLTQEQATRALLAGLRARAFVPRAKGH